MKLITVKTDKSGINIRIPRTLLNHVAKHHPEFPAKINNSQQFMEEIAFQLKENLGDSETGLTGLEVLIDQAIEEVVDNGSGAAESKEES